MAWIFGLHGLAIKNNVGEVAYCTSVSWRKRPSHKDPLAKLGLKGRRKARNKMLTGDRSCSVGELAKS